MWLELNKPFARVVRIFGMPAKSKKQQMAAGAALNAANARNHRFEQMAKSMTEKQLRDFAKTKRKKLPTKKKKKR